MSKEARNIILGDVNNTSIINHQGSFTWTFHDYKKNLNVKIKLDRLWIRFLAEDLWEVINDEHQELSKVEQALKGEEE